MRKLRSALLLLFLLALHPASAQVPGGTGPREKSVKEELKSNKQMRRERREKRRMERAERKAIKNYHKRLQTKNVQKRMKASKNKARRNNENKREFFLTRWFKKKR